MTWCITGASGQLGSVLVRQLAAAGEAVVALSHSRSDPICGVRARPVDVTDFSATGRILEQVRPSIIVHLAAVTGVGQAVQDPQRAQQVNVDATAALVEQEGARFAYTVEAGRVAAKRVRVGRQVGNLAEIPEGLEEGETLIVTGLGTLRQGDAVNPTVIGESGSWQ